jgi:hypothetical protein
MRRPILSSICAVSAALAPGTSAPAGAGEMAYTCTITNVYDLASDGDLHASSWREHFVDQSFSVSRLSGDIVGAVLPTFSATYTRVINPGADDYAFRAVAEFDVHSAREGGDRKVARASNEPSPTANFQLIEIQEFRESVEKPFVAMSMGGAGVVVGVCR